MTPSLQALWSWTRTCQEQWRSLGNHHQMRRKTTDFTTRSRSGTRLSAIGTLWLTISSITSSLPSISCQEGSISSGSMPRMTWGFPYPLSHQPGKWRGWKAGLKTVFWESVILSWNNLWKVDRSSKILKLHCRIMYVQSLKEKGCFHMHLLKQGSFSVFTLNLNSIAWFVPTSCVMWKLEAWQ